MRRFAFIELSQADLASLVRGPACGGRASKAEPAADVGPAAPQAPP